MTKTMNWTGAAGDTLLLKVEQYVKQGVSKEQAFRELEADSKALFGRHIPAERIGGTYHRIRRQRGGVIPRTTSQTVTFRIAGCVVTVPVGVTVELVNL